MATTEQLALLRATVDGDLDKANELSSALHGSGGLDGYDEVVAAAFYLAVQSHFPTRCRMEDVIQLVAEARVRFDPTGDVIDPCAAELVVRSALGERGVLDGLPAAAMLQAEVAICSYLAGEGRLGDPEEFLGRVEKLLGEWSDDGDQ